MKIFSTIDIRKFDDESFASEVLSNISTFRRDRYEKINNEIGKKQTLAVTYLLSKCLLRFGLKENEMNYGIEKNGKLFFENRKDLHFNLSHSKNMALAVVSDKPVGCDIQCVGNVDDKLYDLTLSSDEKNVLFSITDIKARNEKFYEYWAVKEAIIKKDGTGLRDNLSNVKNDLVFIDKITLDEETYILTIV